MWRAAPTGMTKHTAAARSWAISRTQNWPGCVSRDHQPLEGSRVGQNTARRRHSALQAKASTALAAQKRINPLTFSVRPTPGLLGSRPPVKRSGRFPTHSTGSGGPLPGRRPEPSRTASFWREAHLHFDPEPTQAFCRKGDICRAWGEPPCFNLISGAGDQPDSPPRPHSGHSQTASFQSRAHTC